MRSRMRANLARPAGQDLLMKQGYLLTYLVVPTESARDIIVCVVILRM